MARNSKVGKWLYGSSHIILLLFFVGFSIVVPIDAMAQASRSKNDALNTFIVVGAFVVFGILCITITIGRIFVRRGCLQDIPKRYLPLVPEDLPHKGSRNLLLKQMSRSQELSALLQKPKGKIIHDGVAPPVYAVNDETETENSDALPPYLNYEDSIKIITSRLKYQGIFTNIMSLDLNTDDTFSDIMRSLLGDSKEHADEVQEYIDLYETVKFGGREISQQQFLRFMDLSLFFVDILLTRSNVDNRTRSSHNSRLSTSSSTGSARIARARVTPTNTEDYLDSDSLSQSDSDRTTDLDVRYEGEPERYIMRRTNTSQTVARRVTPNSQLNDHYTYNFDERVEPPESQEDYRRSHSIISKIESYNSVVHQPRLQD